MSELPEYSPIEKFEPIGRTPQDVYYQRGFARSSAPFSLPEGIEILLDTVFDLAPEQRNRFELACAWLSVVRELGDVSRSASFIAIVAGLEALLEKGSEPCPSCGQPKFSVARRIREFLHEFVPAVTQDRKQVDRIYRTRSDLAHGLNLLSFDLGRLGLSDPSTAAEMNLQYNAYQSARTAMLNWLTTCRNRGLVSSCERLK